jgi:hypothetical protein
MAADFGQIVHCEEWRVSPCWTDIPPAPSWSRGHPQGQHAGRSPPAHLPCQTPREANPYTRASWLLRSILIPAHLPDSMPPDLTNQRDVGVLSGHVPCAGARRSDEGPARLQLLDSRTPCDIGWLEQVELLRGRRTPIELMFDLVAQALGATGPQKQLPMQRLDNVRTCLTLATLTIQVAMIANSIWGLPLRNISTIASAFT